MLVPREEDTHDSIEGIITVVGKTVAAAVGVVTGRLNSMLK